jgi:hypothetical protein
MLKPGSLRTHLTAAIPELRRNPDQLLVFIDQGSLVATNAEGLSFEYRYTLRLILTDFAGHPDAVMVPLLVWIGIHQSELLAHPSLREQIQFEAELVANDKVDLEIKIPLTERVGVHALPEGGYNVEHYPEPQPEGHLEAEHWEIYAGGELIAEWDVPPQ